MHLLYLLSNPYLPRTTLPQARPSIYSDDAQTQRRTQDILPRIPLPSHIKSITSPSNPFVKHCLKLRQSSTYRHFHGSALVVGTTPISEIYRFQDSIQGSTTMDCLLLLDGTEVPKELCNSPIRIVHVSPLVMKKLSGVQSIDSIEAAALMRLPPSFHDMDDKQKEENCGRWFPSLHRVLVLDGIQDPGNLGTLLRSAMAFRWDGAFLLPGCCDPFNDKVLRATRGASFQLPIVSGNWGHLKTLATEFKMKLLAGHPEITTDFKSSSLLSQKLADSLADNPLCLVLGSEGHGLSDQSKQDKWYYPTSLLSQLHQRRVRL
ncbi:uncharacterized tRNA/rRNA methyltransferase slr1673 isoform X2 [Macadamia integrifolia]|uniref:uncharacterized tRNA/rRNA methyltransferase slr1673 isoform X2 n=1 Tax=Macadamia integrifolia TaxID=60698 RepID=UPI001C500EA1|nr:uncharacterized tRNA/rRNA methyltransferase slr1673 isoform X2 [Macadamia integrifolia]